MISHLIEALGEVADLVGGFDGDLVCQVTAADLLDPLPQSHDGCCEAPTQDMRQTEGHQDPQGGEANSKPELLPNGGIEMDCGCSTATPQPVVVRGSPVAITRTWCSLVYSPWTGTSVDRLLE